VLREHILFQSYQYTSFVKCVDISAGSMLERNREENRGPRQDSHSYRDQNMKEAFTHPPVTDT
jgi:hypothetical protein